VGGRLELGSELSPDVRYVAEGNNGARAGVFAVAEPNKNLTAGENLRGNALSGGRFTDDGRWLVRVASERVDDVYKTTAVVISAATWKVTAAVPLPPGYATAVVSPDGRTLAVACGERVDFYDTGTAALLVAHRVPDGAFHHAHTLSFTPDGTKLITGHADTTALVWPVPDRPAK
jgi:WD40 repeat protein